MTLITINSISLTSASLMTCLLIAVLASAPAGADTQQDSAASGSIGRLLLNQHPDEGHAKNNNKPQLNAKEYKLSLAKTNQDDRLQQQREQFKTGLKKKWHKLLDELIENELPSVSAANERQVETMVNQPVARLRRPVASQQQQQQKPAQAQPGHARNKNGDQEGEEEEEASERLKRKPAVDLGDKAPLSALLSMNNQLDIASPNGNQPQPTQQQRNPVNILDHQRKILNDGFDIRKESIFTANNHLGQKGVPKFGSDEQF